MDKPQPKSPSSDSRQSERAAEEQQEEEGLEEIDLEEEEMQKTQQQNEDDTKQGGKDKDTSSYDHVSDTKSSPVQHRTSGSTSSIYSIHRHAQYWILLLCVHSLCYMCISHLRTHLDSPGRTLTMCTSSSL